MKNNTTQSVKKRLVWDLPLRLFHWLLVLALVTQWLTAEVLDGYNQLHSIVGYITLGLIAFRLIWGFIGPSYARFSDFLYSPKAVFAYIRDLFTARKQQYIGHNPLGGLLVPAVLLLVGLQAISGLFVSDEIFHSGPYYQSINDQVTDTMEWLHHNLFDLLLVLIAFHIVAIFWYQLKLKKNLIKPMVDGHKPVSEQQAIDGSRILRAIILLIVIGVFIYWLVEIAPPEIESDYYF